MPYCFGRGGGHRLIYKSTHETIFCGSVQFWWPQYFHGHYRLFYPRSPTAHINAADGIRCLLPSVTHGCVKSQRASPTRTAQPLGYVHSRDTQEYCSCTLTFGSPQYTCSCATNGDCIASGFVWIHGRCLISSGKDKCSWQCAHTATRLYFIGALWIPGGRLNKKDGLTRYGDSHVKDKTS